MPRPHQYSRFHVYGTKYVVYTYPYYTASWQAAPSLVGVALLVSSPRDSRTWVEAMESS